VVDAGPGQKRHKRAGFRPLPREHPVRAILRPRGVKDKQNDWEEEGMRKKRKMDPG
jgi:hypothetical protein